MQELRLKKYFGTSDLALCTTLISLNFPLDSLDKSDPRKAIFLFKQSEHLQETISLYWKGDLKIEPKEFFTNLKLVKSRLYSEGGRS